jgi:hypothetical protein
MCTAAARGVRAGPAVTCIGSAGTPKNSTGLGVLPVCKMFPCANSPSGSCCSHLQRQLPAWLSSSVAQQQQQQHDFIQDCTVEQDATC